MKTLKQVLKEMPKWWWTEEQKEISQTKLKVGSPGWELMEREEPQHANSVLRGNNWEKWKTEEIEESLLPHKHLHNSQEFEEPYQHSSNELSIYAPEVHRKTPSVFSGHVHEPRHHCELCGAKLKVPETDYSKTAMCDKCVYGQMKSLF